MKPTPALLAAAAALLIATPASAEAPGFSASCPAGVTVKSNGKGKVKINGEKATVKAYSDTAWEASSNGVIINVSREGSGLIVTYTGTAKGANGVCQVTASGAGKAAKAGGVPKKDRKACLAAVTAKSGNSTVEVLEGSVSEANNTVVVGVGPDKAKWKCLVKNGKAAQVTSMTGEGAL